MRGGRGGRVLAVVRETTLDLVWGEAVGEGGGQTTKKLLNREGVPFEFGEICEKMGALTSEFDQITTTHSSESSRIPVATFLTFFTLSDLDLYSSISIDLFFQISTELTGKASPPFS